MLVGLRGEKLEKLERKPTVLGGKPAWFEGHGKADSRKMKDRQLFVS